MFRRALRLLLLDTVIRADDEHVAEAQEQAGFEDSNHRLETGIKLFGVADLGKVAVDDRVSAVGQVGGSARERTDAGKGAQFLKPFFGVLQSDPADLDGDGSVHTKPIDALVGGDDRHAASGDAGDKLFTQQGPAPALDHPKSGIHLIGAVEAHVQAADVVELTERNAQTARQFGGRHAGRHADDFQADLLHSFT